MFFRNAPGLFYFAFLHSYTSFLGLNNLYLQKLLDRINFIILNDNRPGKMNISLEEYIGNSMEMVRLDSFEYFFLSMLRMKMYFFVL